MAEVEWDNREDSVGLNTARLMHHVTEKGWQLGSVIGTAIVVPIFARRYSKAHGSLAGAGPRVLRAAATAALAGVALSAAVGSARVGSLKRSLSDEDFTTGMQDRAYRLHYNRGQVRTDLFCELGMAVGGTAAMLAVSPAAWCVLGGAAVGTVGGLLAHAATFKAAVAAAEKEQ